MTEPPSLGYLNVHSHLLPGIDDGCQTLDESLACARQLVAAGFSENICTPHIWPELFPDNLPENILGWTQDLQAELNRHEIPLQLFAGGEVRLYENIIDWFQAHGVPTLANTRCVLTDFWTDQWPHWADDVFAWLIQENYQPILAHPERINCPSDLTDHIEEVQALGVWLQGNLRCFTGGDGPHADRFVRIFMAEQRYTMLALDSHGPWDLSDRVDGMNIVEKEYSADSIDRLLVTGPRKIFTVDPQQSDHHHNHRAAG